MSFRLLQVSGNIIVFKFFIPFLIVLLGLITFYASADISSDMGWYMNSALNIFLGRGYVNMDGSPIFNRAPLFSLMIAASYWLLGVSPVSALCVVRIFAILNPLALYVIGRKFFSKWIGFSAALLALLSYSLSYWSYRHLDAAWPFFAIISLWIMVKGFEARKIHYFLLSGFFIGLGFLVSETIIISFAIPLFSFLVIKQYRSLVNLRNIVLLYLASAVTILPWLIHLYINSALMGIFGTTGLKVVGDMSTQAFFKGPDAVILYFKPFAEGMLAYYTALKINFFIAPLFVLAWIFTVIRAFRKDKYCVILSLWLLFYLPVICMLGKNNYRLGLGVMLFLLSYLVVANFLFNAGAYAYSALSRLKIPVIKRLPKNMFSYVLISSAIFTQTFTKHEMDKGYAEFFKRSILYKAISRENGQLIVDTLYNRVNGETGDWIKQNLSMGDPLMVSRPAEGKSVYFYAMASNPIFTMPVTFLQPNKSIQLDNLIYYQDIIFLTAWSSMVDSRNYLSVLTQSSLLEAIKKHRVKYILVNKNRNYLSLYFEQNPGFRILKSFNNGEIKLYEIINPKRIDDFKPIVTRSLYFYFTELKKKDYTELNWYKQTLRKKFSMHGKIFDDIFLFDEGAKQASVAYAVEGKVY